MSLPWIKLYNNLPEHPKSDRLAALLDDRRAWTYVVQLWLWASRVAPDGDLSGISDDMIAHRAGWQGDATLFAQALRTTGFLVKSYLHDFREVNEAHAKKLAKDRSRISQKRRQLTIMSQRQSPRASHDVAATLPPLDERRGEEINTKDSPIFENPKIVVAGQEKPKRGRPRKAEVPPDPDRPAGAGNPEWQAEQADGLLWLDAARKVNGLSKNYAKFDKSTWMAFRRARSRYSTPTLISALEALINDPWASKQGLRTLLSDAVIQKGLATRGAHAARVGLGLDQTWAGLDDASVQEQLRESTEKNTDDQFFLKGV